MIITQIEKNYDLEGERLWFGWGMIMIRTEDEMIQMETVYALIENG